MDFESLAGGGGTGIIGAIIGYFGLHRRVSRNEKEKQEKAVCGVLHKSIDTQLGDLKKGQEAIFNKVDDINEYLRNRSKGGR